MNAPQFIKQQIAKNYNVGVSRIRFTGYTEIDKLTTKKELRAKVRSSVDWFKIATRDQTKVHVGTLVTILPKKTRNYKIYTKSAWKKLDTKPNTRVKIVANTNTDRTYKLNRLRSLRAHLKQIRSTIEGSTYRRLRGLVKAGEIKSLEKLTYYVTKV